MSLKSIIKKEIAKIAPTIFNANDIALSEGSFLHENTTLKGTKLRGKLSIGEGCKITGGVRIAGETPIEIDRFTSINGPATEICSAVNSIKIGKFCSIARQVSIQEFNHNHHRLTSYFISQNFFNEDMSKDIQSKGDIIIGNDVWIGAGATILSGVNVGHGAVIAANSVVTKDIPDYAIVGGVPAKTIKMRFEQPIIDRLIQLQWWDWSAYKMKENKTLFEESITLDMLKKF